MTTTQYTTILEAAVPNGVTYLYGYNDEVNQNVTLPLFRVYPLNWGDARGDKFTISQQFFIYVKAATKQAAWDEAIAYFNTFKSNLTGNVQINADPVIPMLLHTFGFNVQETRVVEITVNITIHC